MKAILEFSLPEEQADFDVAQKGYLYACVLEELDEFLRRKTKYEEKESITIEEIRQELHTLRLNRGI